MGLMKQGLLTHRLIVVEYTLIFVSMLNLLNKRGNQEKSDKQINGGTNSKNWFVAGPNWFFSFYLNAGSSTICVCPPLQILTWSPLWLLFMQQSKKKQKKII